MSEVDFTNVNLASLDLNKMPRSEMEALQRLLAPKLNKYIPHVPTAKQTAFLLLNNRESFYGGAAGGGKSDALLMAALQYVDVPGYAALLFRRTYADLTLPGALMDRAAEWLRPFMATGEVRWIDKEKTYVFQCPGGGTSTLTFGYLENENDKYRYQGAELQFIGFDELTQINMKAYTYMFSRLRRLKGVKIPLRVRSASNPGGAGHDWVKQRFLIEGPAKGRIFIPATIVDNPFLDAAEYMESLAELDPITRAQLQEGDWNVKHGGSLFDRTWFKVVEYVPHGARKLRYWDLAATEPKPGKDPDFTVGLKLEELDGIFYISDVRRTQKTPGEIEKLVKQTAQLDGYETQIYMEEEPGSSGKNNTYNYGKILRGYAFWGNRETGAKHLRAAPVSSAAERGLVRIVRGIWNTDFLDELEAYPNVNHDDQLDGLSGAYRMLISKANLAAIPIGIKSTMGSYWRQRETG
jgi:predicted phage terminase large subunit-like protein